MSIPICGSGEMMRPIRAMIGKGCMRGMKKANANEFADQIIQKFDKDGDGALGADELRKMSSSGEGKMIPARSMFGMGSIFGMGNMHGRGCIHGMKKADANEFANRIIQYRDKDGDGALGADELGNLTERLGFVEADFDEDGLIGKEKLISKISEKLAEIGKEPADVVAETQDSSDKESTVVNADAQSISDLVKQLLSQLNLSDEETESFFATMKNYGINVTA